MSSGELVEGWKTEVQGGANTMRAFGRDTSKPAGVSASLSAGPFLLSGKSTRLFSRAI
jgi:hypothetical protein